MQDRNKEADIENGLMTWGGRAKLGRSESNIEVYTLSYVK